MINGKLFVVLVILAAVVIGVVRPLRGQEYVTPVVICAPCDGTAFGVTGTGMVLMSSQGGHGSLWFYSLDKAEAVRVTPNQFGARSQLQTIPKLIGRIDGVGRQLVWPGNP